MNIFESRLAQVGECLEFSGYRNRWGYGQLSVAGQLRYAHRHAWSLTHGEIPAGMVVCHRCDNPACCNVEHLFLGTQRDNVLDMWQKGRGVAPRSSRKASHCKRGHEFDDANTRIGRDGRRACRSCEARRERARIRDRRAR